MTGASGGLGEHFARLCARCGAAVTVGARRRERLEALVGGPDGTRRAHRPRAVDLDVADEASVEAAFAAALAERRRSTCSSTMPASRAPAPPSIRRCGVRPRHRHEPARRVAHFARRGAALAGWRAGGGVIVNIASILGSRVAGGDRALRGLEGRRRADDQGARPRMGALRHPRQRALPRLHRDRHQRGFFETEAGAAMISRIPQRRLGRPEDLDGAFLLLATDACRLDDRRLDLRSTAATSSRRSRSSPPDRMDFSHLRPQIEDVRARIAAFVEREILPLESRPRRLRRAREHRASTVSTAARQGAGGGALVPAAEARDGRPRASARSAWRSATRR